MSQQMRDIIRNSVYTNSIRVYIYIYIYIYRHNRLCKEVIESDDGYITKLIFVFF